MIARARRGDSPWWRVVGSLDVTVKPYSQRPAPQERKVSDSYGDADADGRGRGCGLGLLVGARRRTSRAFAARSPLARARPATLAAALARAAAFARRARSRLCCSADPRLRFVAPKPPWAWAGRSPTTLLTGTPADGACPPCVAK